MEDTYKEQSIISLHRRVYKCIDNRICSLLLRICVVRHLSLKWHPLKTWFTSNYHTHLYSHQCCTLSLIESLSSHFIQQHQWLTTVEIMIHTYSLYFSTVYQYYFQIFYILSVDIYQHLCLIFSFIQHGHSLRIPLHTFSLVFFFK